MKKIKWNKKLPISPTNIPLHVLKVDNTSLTDKQIKNREAVKMGLFTEHEMKGLIDCTGTDLNEMFWVIANEKGEKLLDSLNFFKLNYQHRFDANEFPSFYFHYQYKLLGFIENKIQEIQREYILSKREHSEPINKKYKPLLLKEIATKQGYSPKTMGRLIKQLTAENKFSKNGRGRYYSEADLQKLEKLLGNSLYIAS